MTSSVLILVLSLQGMCKLASMPAGGAVAVATSAAAGSGGASAPAAGERQKIITSFRFWCSGLLLST